jgi:hypothetical protein
MNPFSYILNFWNDKTSSSVYIPALFCSHFFSLFFDILEDRQIDWIRVTETFITALQLQNDAISAAIKSAPAFELATL